MAAKLRCGGLCLGQSAALFGCASRLRADCPAPPRPAPCCSKANPQAFSNVLRRMLEAAGRGMWDADAQTLEQLQSMFAELDDELEGIKR